MKTEEKAERKAQHTPGPWVGGHKQLGCCYVMSGDGQRIIAECGRTWPGDYEERIANTHLIAAAPEMLRLIKRVASRGLIECRNCNGTGQWKRDGCIVCGGVGQIAEEEITVQDVLDARAVIKATGGQP